jgi:hypothetical protein
MGALTIKPLAFKVRPWELTNIEITNFVESYNGKIAIQKRGNEIIRILPTRKDSYYWISDKVRFIFESVKKQRINYPYLLIKNKYIKINWEKVVLYIKYIKYIIEEIDNINKIEQQIEQKNKTVVKNIIVNKNAGKNDLISNILLNNIIATKNLIKYETKNYNGNINEHFYPKNIFRKIKAAKYNIINNINIVSDYPRIWLLIKNSKILIIGTKKNVKFKNYTINNTNSEIFKIEKAKSILGFYKKQLLIYTEEIIKKIKISQILLNKNTENFNNIWISNKSDNFVTEKNTVNWIFSKNKEITLKKQGISLNFLTHGIESNQGYSIIFPITTFLEEYSLRLDTYGKIQKTIPVNIRGINMRNIAQILFLIKILLNQENNNENTIEFKLLQDILILKYGLIIEHFKKGFNFLLERRIQSITEKVNTYNSMYGLNWNKQEIQDMIDIFCTEDFRDLTNKKDGFDFIFKNKTRRNKINLIENQNTEELLFKHSNVLQIKESISKKKNNY